MNVISSSRGSEHEICISFSSQNPTQRSPTRMNCNPFLFLLLYAILESSFGADTSYYKDEECPEKDNQTQSCCMNKKYEVEGVCKTSCYGEYCSLLSDCGSAQNMVCCDDHICRNTYRQCPSRKWPIWITVVVVLVIVVAVLGIGGTIFYIYWRHRHRYPPGTLLILNPPREFDDNSNNQENKRNYRKGLWD